MCFSSEISELKCINLYQPSSTPINPYQSMTIQCTNPTCKTIIPVPPGNSYVVCPVCNTWHFPSDFENNSPGMDAPPAPPSYPPSYPAMGDYLPPAAPPPLVSPELPSSNPYPNYQSDGNYLPNQDPTFHRPAAAEKQAAQLPGWLLLPEGKRLQLMPGINIIGRKCGELSIDDPTVSRRHCVLEVSPAPTSAGFTYLLYDIGALDGNSSTNGVFITGRSLRLQNNEKLTVQNGTIIKLGTVRVVLQCHE